MPEAESAVSSGANLWVAVADGDMERVKYLLEHEGVTSTSKDESGYTPLHAAASYNQHELLQYLLEQADDAQEAINVTDNDGDTPLFFCDVLETAKLVVEKHGADAQHRNHEGRSAAQNALENDSDDIAAYLASKTGETLAYEEQAPMGEEEEDPRVDEVMQRIEDIMQRAEDTQTDPTEELQQVVGASIVRQIMEGYGRAT